MEPAHACSLSVTVPHAAPVRAVAVPTAASAAPTAEQARPVPTTAAAPSSETIRHSRLLCRPSMAPLRDRASTRALAPRPTAPLGGAVEGDPEREDRDRRDHALPERVALQALRDLAAERAEPTSRRSRRTASTMTIPWLTPSMIASRASGIFTFVSTCRRVAPNDAAASTASGDSAQAARDEPDHDGHGIQHLEATTPQPSRPASGR